MRAAQATETIKRSPDAVEAFLSGPLEGRTIGISADAVRELYGEKFPELNDGKLGWVQNIEQQLRLAEHTGGDIEVPLAGWLARVDPAVAKQLEEHLRIRPQGMTLWEVETNKK